MVDDGAPVHSVLDSLSYWILAAVIGSFLVYNSSKSLYIAAYSITYALTYFGCWPLRWDEPKEFRLFVRQLALIVVSFVVGLTIMSIIGHQVMTSWGFRITFGIGYAFWTIGLIGLSIIPLSITISGWNQIPRFLLVLAWVPSLVALMVYFFSN